MALDGLVVHAITHELSSCIGGRIHKIHQPSSHDIVVQIRTKGETKKLIISANPTYPRIHYTDEQFLNPLEAPMFCMLLRKHCENGLIESIEQVGMERIIHLNIRQRDELGDTSRKRIIVELMGRHSNIILVQSDTNTILDGIRHVTPAISSYRIVMPGSEYTSPPDQEKRNPIEHHNDWQLLIISDESDRKPMLISASIVHTFSGISPLVAKEIVHRTGFSPNDTIDQIQNNDQQLQRLKQSFQTVIDAIRDHRYHPEITMNDQGKSVFSVIELTHREGVKTVFTTVSHCLQVFYSDKAERDVVKQRTNDLWKLLHNEKSKNAKKLMKLQDTVVEAEQADQYRIMGELLTASMHSVQQGDHAVDVPNYYDEDQGLITIPLDPQRSPSENAQQYFKKYTKIKNSKVAAGQQIKTTEAEIRYLETLIQQLDNATLHDIEEIREELVGQGYLRERGKKKRSNKKQQKPLLNCYLSSENIPIYVGKNNTQNDYLTNRVAHHTDTWLHTKDIPGSHVVIKSSTFNDETLEEAAQLAAYFSQARQSSQVPVDYTLVRHVRKPNGAKPGYVIYDNQKTRYVTPDAARIESWKFTLK